MLSGFWCFPESGDMVQSRTDVPRTMCLMFMEKQGHSPGRFWEGLTSLPSQVPLGRCGGAWGGPPWPGPPVAWEGPG